MSDPSRGLPPGGLRGFAAENGWLLLVERVVGSALRRMRDASLGRKLRTRGFRVGRTPRLLGLAHMTVGENFSAGHDLWLEAVTSFAGQALQPELRIGAHCNLSDSVHIGCAGRVTIGSGLLCGSRVLIIDHAHGSYGDLFGSASDPAVRPNLRPLSVGGAITIGDNVWVGDGAVILPGAHIGDGAVIGANSVVNGPVPPATVAAGAPLRLLRRWDAGTQTWRRLPK